jgi:hypothetical protein
MAKNAEKLLSLRPSEAVQGGLIDNVDVTFKSAAFQLFDYQGKAEETVALRIEMVDEDDAVHEQFFSVGNPKFYAPSSDGDGLVMVSDKGSLAKGSNYIEFMTSLVNAGFPEPALDEGISVIVGTKVHVVRRPATKRSGGIINQPGEGQREKTVLEVSKLIELPPALQTGKAAKGSGKTTATASGRTNGAPKESAGGELDIADEQLAEFVKAQLDESGDDMKVTDLVQVVFSGYPKGQDKKAATKRVVKPDFLQAASKAGYFLYDKDEGEVSARPA